MNHPYTDGYEPTVPTFLFALLLGATLILVGLFAYAGAEDRETDDVPLWETSPVSTDVEGGEP